MTPKNWLNRSNAYATAIGAAGFSPSRSVAGLMNTETEPLPHVSNDERDALYYHRAEAFIRSTLARAGSTVSAWTRNAVEAHTAGYGPQSSLFVSGESILQRGADPDAAADYATGRLLIAASQRQYLTREEREKITESVARYRRAAGPGFTRAELESRAVQYATAHLAGTVATIRGREAVLAEWRGWAGYFKAAESDRATPEAAAAFLIGPAPAIVRAAFALGEIISGRAPDFIPSDLAPLIDLARPHFDTAWKKGDHWSRAAAAVAAMLPPEHGTGDPEGNAGDQGGTEEGGGTGGGDSSPAPGSAAEIPASEADQMVPDKAREQVAASTRTDPASPGKGPKPPSGMRHYPIRIIPANDPHPDNLEQTRKLAAPMIAALRRIVWDSMTPPSMDRAQMRGELDEGMLPAFAAFNDPRVFQTRQEIAPSTVAVSILIDCSGSMGFTGYDGGTRIASAKAVGYALATVFNASPMHRVSVIGHDVRYDRGGAVCVYDTGDQPNRIASLRAGGDNADGFAIAHAIDRTLKANADRRAVFLLADGSPSANGYGSSAATKHIRNEIARGVSRGVEFLAIGIDGAMAEGSGASLFGTRFVSIPNTRGAGPLLARIIGKIGRSPCA